ncbi:MAG: hypothetical protein JXA23_02395 [Bacteroidales bacterium]|nr:hypothetical protein [Bacteroidales bacterium]
MKHSLRILNQRYANSCRSELLPPRKLFRWILLLSVALGYVSCEKSQETPPPAIFLMTGSEYTPNNAVTPIGGSLRFGIIATGEEVNLTNLVIKKVMPDGSSIAVFDSGMNTPGISISKTFFQSVEDTAQWVFQVMDRSRKFATTSLTLFKDPNSTWGGIWEHPLITLGYQQNTTNGQFLDPASGTVYSTDSAALFQELIDIVVYYFVDEELPSPTFSSPGESGGGIEAWYPSIATWSTKRYTKYDISVDANPIPVEAFEACHNDSLLILSYDDVWGKRKFKWADPGDVIPFLTAGGKKGLIRILTADHDPTGSLSFSVKIQQ